MRAWPREDPSFLPLPRLPLAPPLKNVLRMFSAFEMFSRPILLQLKYLMLL
ncbi:hypothetical protein ZEAMMB73_Zm00001d047301 [Zea mays]|uniref:Uncharacterized protein n=1 Tax=Zea mays TaxID=4577 RepID=A0A1D6P8G7_MAIZE|nr:hypothetical protein ZEAMMB73_Zm00001d047301 [Zea mays]